MKIWEPDVLATAARLRASSEPYLVATVVRVRGSSYRRPGARLVVTHAGRAAGSVSGGCLDVVIARTGWWRTERGAATIMFDSRDAEDGVAVLGCGGQVEILIERGYPGDALSFAVETLARAQRGAIMTVFASTTPSFTIGKRWCVHDAVAAPAPLMSLADEAIRSGSTFARDLDIDGGTISVLVEGVAPPLSLFVLGAGLDAVPLVENARKLGWRTHVWSPAPRFEHASRFPGVALLPNDLSAVRERIDATEHTAVVIMTHDKRYDRAALAATAASRAAYIGLLGPRHRAAEVADPAVLADPRVHAPVGLDIGAETPDEIAVAIVAEILSSLRRCTAVSLHGRDHIHAVDEHAA